MEKDGDKEEDDDEDEEEEGCRSGDNLTDHKQTTRFGQLCHRNCGKR